MNQYIGMNEDETNIYSVARFVRLQCGRLDAFMRVLEMCGYEIKRKAPANQERKA